MKRVLSGTVAVVLVVSSSGAGPVGDRSPRAIEDQVSVEKRLGELEAKVRVQQKMLDQLARMKRLYLFVPPNSQPWTETTPDPHVVPGSGEMSYSLVPDPATAAFAPGRFDRCLITVNGANFDSDFVVKFPEVDSRMIVAPRVKGLPAGSRPFGFGRP